MTTTIAADFSVLQGAITTQFDRMKGHSLFRVDVSGDELWDTYLASFPEGTNLVCHSEGYACCIDGREATATTLPLAICRAAASHLISPQKDTGPTHGV